jgi:pyruvate/2-oxoglutarate/acetoin dehydrogenase E1 component
MSYLTWVVGTDVTLVTFSKMVGHALKAADALATKGISAEVCHHVRAWNRMVNRRCRGAQVINLRSIRPLDRATIVESVKKTRRIVTIEEGWPQHGVGAEIQAVINESGFLLPWRVRWAGPCTDSAANCAGAAWDYLDAPPARVTGEIGGRVTEFVAAR